MNKFKIITDSGCDLSDEMINFFELGYIGLVCEIDGETIIEDCGKTLSYSEFYNRVSNGAMPKTSQVNPNRFYDEFGKYLSEGQDILYISFSSQLSGTYNSALIAKEELLEKYTDAKIIILDSKSASCGLGLLVYKAAMLKKEGKSIEEIAEMLEKYKNELYCYFTVKDLKHLERGGRISGMSAMLGTMLNISPILEVSNKGTLQNVGKVRGEKKAVRELVKKIEEAVGDKKIEEVFISHADNSKAAEMVVDLIKEKFNPENIYTDYMGLAIGSHTGQGAVGIFFLGKSR